MWAWPLCAPALDNIAPTPLDDSENGVWGRAVRVNPLWELDISEPQRVADLDVGHIDVDEWRNDRPGHLRLTPIACNTP